jgi:hypothetical protein
MRVNSSGGGMHPPLKSLTLVCYLLKAVLLQGALGLATRCIVGMVILKLKMQAQKATNDFRD